MLRPLQVSLVGGYPAYAGEILESLSNRFPQAKFTIWDSTHAAQSEPTFLVWLGPAENRINFEQLPTFPLIDLSHTTTRVSMELAAVLQSATGDCRRLT